MTRILTAALIMLAIFTPRVNTAHAGTPAPLAVYATDEWGNPIQSVAVGVNTILIDPDGTKHTEGLGIWFTDMHGYAEVNIPENRVYTVLSLYFGWPDQFYQLSVTSDDVNCFPWGQGMRCQCCQLAYGPIFWTGGFRYTPTPSLTPSPTLTVTPSLTPWPTQTPKPTTTFTPTPTRTLTPTPTLTPTQTPFQLVMPPAWVATPEPEREGRERQAVDLAGRTYNLARVLVYLVGFGGGWTIAGDRLIVPAVKAIAAKVRARKETP